MVGNSPWLCMSSRLITTKEVCFHRDSCPSSDEQDVDGTHRPPRPCETSFTDPQTDLFLPFNRTAFLPSLPATWTFMKVEKEQLNVLLSKEAALIVPEGPVYY